MLKDDEFTQASSVDRYGRKIKSDARKKALERLYENADEKDEEDASAGVEVDDDDVVEKELKQAETKYDPARQGGYSSSESDSEEEEEVASDTGADEGTGEGRDVETGEVTKRIAVLGVDWDYVNSTDLMVLFSSFLGADAGRIEKISVYPSEFGKERMKREELGPPQEIFKDGKKEEDEESDEAEDDESEDERIKKELIKEGDDQEFDREHLRKYQLDRLRYYYAVMVCSDTKAAKTIYDATDMTEYQSSSNFLDLRFIPDDTTFDDEARDECGKIPDSYKPKEFVTNALQSSNVKLTWDMHPEEASRKESIKRAFGGSRNDIEENDLKAYLASDSEDDGFESFEEEEEAAPTDAAPTDAKLSKKELARQKMRDVLGLSNEPATKKAAKEPVGEMQVTFSAALAEEKKAKPEGEETTIEKYKRKERERREQRRQKAIAARGVESEEEEEQVAGKDDLGFNDPFFTVEDPEPKTKSSIRKEERMKKREARDAHSAETVTQRKQLEKIMADHDEETGDVEHLDHFDMTEILRAENKKGKKQKGKKSKKDDSGPAGLQEDFKINVEDPRFKAVFDDHDFAIDPSNPNFKSTQNMKMLLDEGRKKRRHDGVDDDGGKKKARKEKREDNVGGLVASLKKKSSKR